MASVSFIYHRKFPCCNSSHQVWFLLSWLKSYLILFRKDRTRFFRSRRICGRKNYLSWADFQTKMCSVRTTFNRGRWSIFPLEKQPNWFTTLCFEMLESRWCYFFKCTFFEWLLGSLNNKFTLTSRERKYRPIETIKQHKTF